MFANEIAASFNFDFLLSLSFFVKSNFFWVWQWQTAGDGDDRVSTSLIPSPIPYNIGGAFGFAGTASTSPSAAGFNPCFSDVEEEEPLQQTTKRVQLVDNSSIKRGKQFVVTGNSKSNSKQKKKKSSRPKDPAPASRETSEIHRQKQQSRQASSHVLTEVDRNRSSATSENMPTSDKRKMDALRLELRKTKEELQKTEETLETVQQNNALLQEKRGTLTTELNHAKVQLREMDAKNKRLCARLAAQGGEKNDAVVDAINTKVKDFLWRTTKFISSDPGLRRAASKVMRMFPENSTLSTSEQENWLATYQQNVNTAVNNRRSYVQGEMRVKAHKWMDEGNELPTVKDMLMCATRDIPDPGDDRMMNIFVFYWDVILPVVAGAGQKTWGPNKRHYELISDARAVDDPSKPLFGHSTEAFVVVQWENNYDRWLASYAYKKEHNVKKLPTRKGDLKDADFFDGKFTDQNGGQQAYGGWTEKGLQQFNSYQEMIKDRRAQDNYATEARDLETIALASIKNKHGIQAATAKQNRKRKRKGKDDQPPKPAAIETYMESDDEN